MSPILLITFFPLVVAISPWYRGKHSEQAGRFSTLSLDLRLLRRQRACLRDPQRDRGEPAARLLTHMVCFVLTLYFSARVVRLAGFRWYDVIVVPTLCSSAPLRSIFSLSLAPNIPAGGSCAIGQLTRLENGVKREHGKEQNSPISCTACGSVFTKWSGRCDGCGEWNTISEDTPISSGPSSATLGSSKGKINHPHGFAA